MIYLYLIGSDAGPFKIGITGSLTKRLEAINCAAPFRNRLHAAVALPDRAAAEKAERSVHRTLSAYRRNGEWFDCDLAIARLAIAGFGEVETPASLPVRAGPTSIEDNTVSLLKIMAQMSDENVVELARITGGPPERHAFAQWRAEQTAIGG